jgi:glycine cleavage system aminomethyltransferase T/glycine/D-amino acid oxidase-like deaminating enzyme
MSDLPSQARAVIIGGGIVGCSVAYHLTKLGWRDIVLLERRQLTSGTTWHAAGLIAQLRATHNMTRLSKYSGDLYERLEAETGLATGFRRNGSISVALTKARMEELARNAAMARQFGVENEVLSPAECREAYPLMNLDGVVGGVYIPKDGQGDPTNIALSLAKGARLGGARIIENVKVNGITRSGCRVSGVTTDQGDITADVVVNCAGMWGRTVGAMAGVNVPLQACEHFYIVTEAIPGLSLNLPTLRVPDECAYFKQDAGKLLLGAFEPRAKPWAMNGIPEDFCFDQLPEDLDHFAPILEMAVKRVPVLEHTGIHTFFNGPESFTPDDRYLLGEAPELDGFYVACGFNSIGIQSAGGAGKVLAEWIDAGEAPCDLWDVDIRRMYPFQGTKAYISARVSETLGLLYADHFPYRQYETARNVRHTPFHDILHDHGACFGELAGWERANWFLPRAAREAGERAEYKYSWGRQNWFPHSAAEHLAVRNGVGMFDLSGFAKFRVEGRDAEAVLQRISANDLAVLPGKIVYTQWLNDHGGIEADLTITRLSETLFVVITSAANAIRDFAWLKRHIPDDAHCIATDVTSGEGVLAIMGPRSRDLLQSLTGDDLSNAAFPFATARQIELGMALVRAHRITYVGELGWELYIPADFCRHVAGLILEAGANFGLKLCGMHALDSCRIEKGYRHFGHDITDEDHVLEAGLGFALKLHKPEGKYGPFIGRNEVLWRKEMGLTRRLLQFRLRDPEPLLLHNEPIYRDGKSVGFITSGAYGHHLGSAVGMGYVGVELKLADKDLLAASYSIDIAGRLYQADVSLKPFYDPEQSRIHA